MKSYNRSMFDENQFDSKPKKCSLKDFKVKGIDLNICARFKNQQKDKFTMHNAQGQSHTITKDVDDS